MTDITVIAVYYTGNHLKHVPEFWVKTKPQRFVPIHEMVAALGPLSVSPLTFHPQSEWKGHHKLAMLHWKKGLAEIQQKCGHICLRRDMP